MSVRIAVLLGSLRKDSLNRRLVTGSVLPLLAKLGAEADVIDLKQTVLPIYDEDLDPASIPALGELLGRLERAHGFLVVSPEYNYGIPGGLKNALDWVSHPPPGPLNNKPAGLLGATSGRLGTAHTQASLRTVLGYMGVLVAPAMLLLPHAQDAITDGGELKQAPHQAMLTKVVGTLVKLAMVNPLAPRKTTA